MGTELKITIDRTLYLRLIAVALLIVAVAPLPYGYYQMLRWVVGGIAIYYAYISYYEWKKKWAIWIFFIIAVLFNPIIPIHLTREVWQRIDVVCAGLFGSSILWLNEPRREVTLYCFCPNCGYKITAKMTFCPGCGKQLTLKTELLP